MALNVPLKMTPVNYFTAEEGEEKEKEEEEDVAKEKRKTTEIKIVK